MSAVVRAAAIITGVLIPWTRRADADAAHTIHIAGCVECASDDEWLGV